MTSLTSLIERIEAATGGDRELDAEIWLACTPGATRDKWSYVHRATGRECTVDETRNATDRLIIVPSYTTSIDAALTLLPEGNDWSLFFDNGAALAGCQPASEDGCDITDTPGATPALALLAAILSARQAADTEGQS